MISDLGEVNVVTAQGEWKQIGKSDLGENVYASPAIADGRIYVKTTESLFCFGLED
jgi:hypothetical protein